MRRKRGSCSTSVCPGTRFVQDTKDRDGGTLAFGPAAWSSFVELAKQAR
jgi:hypothetical protein